MKSSCWKLIVLLILIACPISMVEPGSKKDADGSVLPPRPSYSDNRSRLLAQRTLQDLGEMYVDYRVGPEDLLEVSIFEWELREETKTANFRVAESGIVSLPVIGDIEVGEKTVKEIKSLIEDKLKTGGFLLQPRVSINIKEFRSKRVAIVGAVNDPGVYTLRRNVTTLLEILSLAGGVSERAGHLLYVIRPRTTMARESSSAPKATTEPAAAAVPEVRKGEGFSTANTEEVVAIDLYELMELGNMDLNMVLRNGDIVNVPEAKKFSVLGYVREPGVYPLKKPTTVLEGVSLAGGLMVDKASPGSCILKRQVTGKDVILSLNLDRMAKGKDQNLYLLPDDIVYVGPATGKMVAGGVLHFVTSIFHFGFWLNGPK